MISVRLKKFLDDNEIGYDVVQHDPAFTAQELAARMHVPGREFVKVVVIKMDGGFALAVVPAHRRIDLRGLAKAAGTRKCAIATEKDFQGLFPDCELGAMPPFGNLYGMQTYVDQEVAYNEVIVINAGTHAEAIRIRFRDVRRLVRPRIGQFAVPPPIEVAARRRANASAGRKKARKKAAKKKATGKKSKKKTKKKVKKKARKRPAKRKAAKKVKKKTKQGKKTKKAKKAKKTKKRTKKKTRGRR